MHVNVIPVVRLLPNSGLIPLLPWEPTVLSTVMFAVERAGECRQAVGARICTWPIGRRGRAPVGRRGPKIGATPVRSGVSPCRRGLRSRDHAHGRAEQRFPVTQNLSNSKPFRARHLRPPINTGCEPRYPKPRGRTTWALRCAQSPRPNSAKFDLRPVWPICKGKPPPRPKREYKSRRKLATLTAYSPCSTTDSPPPPTK